MFSLCMVVILAHSEDECNKKDASHDTLKNNLVGGEVFVVHARYYSRWGRWVQVLILFFLLVAFCFWT